jgi:hypothetical protein
VFPRWTLSKPRKECEVDGGEAFGHGVRAIEGFVESHLWVPCIGCCAPSFSMQSFCKPIYCHELLKCSQVEAKVGFLSKHEKHCPP